MALLLASKTLAALEERDFVTPDDVRVLVPPALRHRIVLCAEAEIEGQTPDSTLARTGARTRAAVIPTDLSRHRDGGFVRRLRDARPTALLPSG